VAISFICTGFQVCRNDPSPDYGRYALKAYKLLKSERQGDSWMLDVGHLSLNNRLQQVLLDGHTSSTAEVLSGVPQEAVLGVV
jgi:hypothetical protein